MFSVLTVTTVGLAYNSTLRLFYVVDG